MLEDRLGLVLLDALWHHVEDVVHHRCTQLEIVVRLHALLRHSLGSAFAVAALELTREQVTEPAFEQRNDAAHEEEPDSPAWCPETNTGTLADRTRVESVVDEMLQVLTHPHLTHEL